jgi:hypothetical protein
MQAEAVKVNDVNNTIVAHIKHSINKQEKAEKKNLHSNYIYISNRSSSSKTSTATTAVEVATVAATAKQHKHPYENIEEATAEQQRNNISINYNIRTQ